MKKSKVVHYPKKIKNLPVDCKVVYLAGPVKHAPDWHSRAIKIIHDIDPEVIIISPKKLVLSGFHMTEWYKECAWIKYHMDLTGGYAKGVIMFWCPPMECQERPNYNGSYAQSTRYEVGKWFTRLNENPQEWPGKVIMGMEHGFSGARYVDFDLKADYGVEIFWGDLQEFCYKTLEII
ncbi:hypothetical protein KKC17_03600 [Patescibacteria group bacterium]|nr:hypothetical protein [Patescibacteria group bacterium]